MEDNKNQSHDPYNMNSESEEYGLPELNFEPIKREEENEVVTPVQKKTPPKEEKKKSNIIPILIGAFIIVLIFGGALYYFVLSENEVEQQTYVPYEAEIPEVVEEEPVDNYADFTPVETYEEPVATQGSLTIVNGRTNRNYIVVGSFFDEDNANDYGNKLASQGIEAKIIKGRRFHKLAVADYDTFDEASDRITNFKETYGEQIWVLTY